MEVTKGKGIFSVLRPIMAQGTGLEAERELGETFYIDIRSEEIV